MKSSKPVISWYVCMSGVRSCINQSNFQSGDENQRLRFDVSFYRQELERLAETSQNMIGGRGREDPMR